MLETLIAFVDAEDPVDNLLAKETVPELGRHLGCDWPFAPFRTSLAIGLQRVCSGFAITFFGFVGRECGEKKKEIEFSPRDWRGEAVWTLTKNGREEFPFAAPFAAVAGTRTSVRQLGEVGRDLPCLILREQIGGYAPAGLILEVDIRELLPVLVAENIRFDPRFAVTETRRAVEPRAASSCR